ncbi:MULTISPECIES: RNA methyltransferase [Listeria]|uniref:TrmH family RNA methyltransferase n=1 Tax=Listeria TaxID=1637 RepID=UPI000B594792|nr:MULTISPECIES: RNA methyltransferase [Listeria]
MDTIRSTKNERVKNWKKLFTTKGRQKSGTYMVEGFHLVEEALRQDGLVRELILSEEVYSPLELPEDIETFYVSKEVSHFLSETKTEQGIFAVINMTEADILLLYGKKLLLVDRVQDPGNVGTLIRTADAAGYDAVVLGRGSADLYNPKVIRSAQGSHFHIPVIQAPLLEWIGRLEEEGVPVFGAFLDEQAKVYDTIPRQETLALIVGNEGSGISNDVAERIHEKVYIPIFGQSESLNVAIAAGILMYHFRK